MNDKTTPWFPADVTPVRDGVYQVRIREKIKYSRWADDRWHLALFDFEPAKVTDKRSSDCYSHLFGGWRGLAEQTT